MKRYSTYTHAYTCKYCDSSGNRKVHVHVVRRYFFSSSFIPPPSRLIFILLLLFPSSVVLFFSFLPSSRVYRCNVYKFSSSTCISLLHWSSCLCVDIEHRHTLARIQLIHVKHSWKDTNFQSVNLTIMLKVDVCAQKKREKKYLKHVYTFFSPFSAPFFSHDDTE